MSWHLVQLSVFCQSSTLTIRLGFKSFYIFLWTRVILAKLFFKSQNSMNKKAAIFLMHDGLVKCETIGQYILDVYVYKAPTDVYFLTEHNFDHQMSRSKLIYLLSNNCFNFFSFLFHCISIKIAIQGIILSNLSKSV